jgi:ribosomal protein S18 acetylase RimI-like enzyme
MDMQVGDQPAVTAFAAKLANDNIIEAIREHAAWQTPCVLLEEPGMIMMAGATSFPGAFKNCVARTDPATPAKQVIAHALGFFGARGRSFTVLVRGAQDADLEAYLRAQGFAHRFDTPCMLVAAPVQAQPIAAHLRMESLVRMQQVSDAVLVLARAYQALGLAAQVTSAYFTDPAKLVARGTNGCIVYDRDQPLATALMIKHGKAAGLYWVGTVPEAQRMGLASACAARLTNEAFSQGAEVVTLQASALGEPVYRRLGYQSYDRLKFFRSLEPACR